MADRVDRLVALCAGLGAITAVAVSLYQAALARAQLRASAWPYVTQSNSLIEGSPYVRTVTNAGVGPARVRTFHVFADGRPVPTWSAAVRALTGADDPGAVYSSFGRGTVLPAGETRTLLTLPPGPRASAFWRAAQERLVTVVCFCSIYDECWRADDREDEPEPVRACPASDATAFRR